MLPINDLPRLKRGFYSLQHFLGAIDCTHIPIISPGGDNAEVFRNRKGFHVPKVQAVCDYERKFINLVERWPGSTHDSRIFENSRLRGDIHYTRLDGVLLGDNGCMCRKCLSTPALDPRTQKQRNYNRAQIATRMRVEQCFGVMKQRFGALRIPLEQQWITR